MGVCHSIGLSRAAFFGGEFVRGVFLFAWKACFFVWSTSRYMAASSAERKTAVKAWRSSLVALTRFFS